ncbi:helix-turn-helix domain-containing protein [Nocardiopsis metallicus]|uniref:Transcriptional regulator with XRE-family HTH domain n=1 Tax=Nocardiopsis metallicus TaxID=179819 RepID=A0A840WSD4_9ACTN|nr:helix-turn-helix transcriptional regulator [Nocardiopsis metallicus]MBB5494467.1 transcriptional regulator with XRE-family HTH domain [Nocardiopsis metallicus]
MPENVLHALDEARRGDRSHGQVPERTHERPDEPLMRDLIGDLLRRTRTEQGRTLREVAEDAQVSLPYLSEIERGRKEASSEVLAAVYRSLGLSIVDVLGELYRRTHLARFEVVGQRQAHLSPVSAPLVAQAHQARVMSLAA